MRVLFVCSGNICRSPMAEALFRHRARLHGLSHVVASSAGTLGIHGSPAAPQAMVALREVDVDLSPHRSRGVNRSILQSTDLTIVMDHGHLKFLAESYPDGGDRRFLLRAFESGPRPVEAARDLDDPVGDPIGVFRKQREMIVTCVDHLAQWIHQSSGIGS